MENNRRARLKMAGNAQKQEEEALRLAGDEL